METDRIERETTLDATPDEVWPALTDAEQLSEWFGADVELEAEPGGRARFRFPDGTQRGAVVEEVTPPERLTFRWLPFEVSPDGSPHPMPATRVEFTLVEVPDGTIVRVVESRAFALAGPALMRTPPRILALV